MFDGNLVTFFQVFTALGYIYGIFLLIVQRGYQEFSVVSVLGVTQRAAFTRACRHSIRMAHVARMARWYAER